MIFALLCLYISLVYADYATHGWKCDVYTDPNSCVEMGFCDWVDMKCASKKKYIPCGKLTAINGPGVTPCPTGYVCIEILNELIGEPPMIPSGLCLYTGQTYTIDACSSNAFCYNDPLGRPQTCVVGISEANPTLKVNAPSSNWPSYPASNLGGVYSYSGSTTDMCAAVTMGPPCSTSGECDFSSSEKGQCVKTGNYGQAICVRNRDIFGMDEHVFVPVPPSYQSFSQRNQVEANSATLAILPLENTGVKNLIIYFFAIIGLAALMLRMIKSCDKQMVTYATVVEQDV